MSSNNAEYIDNIESACKKDADCFNKEVVIDNKRTYMDAACPKATEKFLAGDEHLCEDLEGCYHEFSYGRYPVSLHFFKGNLILQTITTMTKTTETTIATGDDDGLLKINFQ